MEMEPFCLVGVSVYQEDRALRCNSNRCNKSFPVIRLLFIQGYRRARERNPAGSSENYSAAVSFSCRVPDTVLIL
jgi:hypothetical protein